MNRCSKIASTLVACALVGATPFASALAKEPGQPTGQRQAQQQTPKTPKTPKTNRGTSDCSKITDPGKRDECAQAQHVKTPADKPSTTPATPATPAVPGSGNVQTKPATPATPATPGGGRGK
ncbi:MAG TPA: hypothetical protein VJR58_05710 [Vineibacter sp.]|nr:hypothetical protein [Vineibacter sp.]